MPSSLASSAQPITPTKILLMDSGLGGLTVAEAILKKLPHVQLIYLADTAAFPYGTRSEGDIENRLTRIALPLAREVLADVVVIACNSASTTVLPVLRQRMSTPIVGVVPAIKPAAQLTQTGCIGLLATPGTVERPYTNDLIASYAKNVQVLRKGSSELVHWAERKMQGKAPSTKQLQTLFIDWEEKVVDTVVLGCTHFPLLKNELSEALPQVKHWVDSGEAIARRVESLMPLSPLQVSHDKQHCPPIHRLLATELTANLKKTECAISKHLSIKAAWELWQLPK